ncbi:MAG: ABC transporter ATP-binding protein [Candidatus Competibacterales bacterium]
MAPLSKASASASSFNALGRLLRYARQDRPQVVRATAYSVANKLFDIAPEILIGIAIDVVVNREASFLAHLGLADPLQQIYALGVLTFLIWAGESLFEYLYAIEWRNLAQTLQHRLRLDAYGHVQRLDIGFFEERSTGDLVAVLNDDINQLERFLDGGANSLIQVATSVVAVGGVFFILSPLLTLLAFTPVPVIIIGAFYFQRRATPLYRQVRERAGALGARLNNNLSGIATIKAFTAEDHELARLRADSEAYCRANAKAIAVSSAFNPLIRMAVLAGFLCTFTVGGYLTLQGELNVGAYGLLVFLTQRLLWPLTDLAQTVDLFERAMASTRRILDLLALPAAPEGRLPNPGSPSTGDAGPTPTNSNHQTTHQTPHQTTLAFREVTFGYDPERPVLREVSFTVPQGHTVALVGQTGSGKTTVIKLLLGFYQPQHGEVIIDGQPLEHWPRVELRQRLGLVSQEVYLFQGTVAENIAYGRPGAPQADIEAAARAAEAHGFIAALPRGYDTWVGERGQKLSGGQRQRIGLARALLKDPPILLLDEATSAVDNETEAAIQRALTRATQGRTTVMIAHRLSTVVHADEILLMEDGRIVERGDHRSLLDRGGRYSALWRVQTGTAVPEMRRVVP